MSKVDETIQDAPMENQEIQLMKKQLRSQRYMAVMVSVLCAVVAAVAIFLAVHLTGTLNVLDQTLKDLDQTVETLDMDQVNEAVDNLNRTVSPIVDLIESLK